MKRNTFNALTVLSLILGIASATIIVIESETMRLTAALTGLSGYLLIEYARDNSVSLPNLSQVKVELNLVENLFELLLLGSFLVNGPIPKSLSILVLISLLVLRVSTEQLANKLKMSLESGLGVGWRIYTLIGLIAISSLNNYFLFYGSFVYLAVIVYDIGNLLYQFYEKRKGVKLKNRILSN